jgi:ATP-binding protein involved in chromosome partitioning
MRVSTQYVIFDSPVNARAASTKSLGWPILDPKEVPLDVQPVKIAPVGRYGIQIHWSDGHSTGILTFRDLRALCPCEVCRASSENDNANQG